MFHCDLTRALALSLGQGGRKKVKEEEEKEERAGNLA